MTNKWIPVAMVLFCSLLGATAQILFKAGSKQLSLSWQLIHNWQLLLGMVLYFVSMVIYLIALRNMDVSRLYPIVASSYIWAALLAFLFLGEHITMPTMAGIALVIVGISVLALQ